MNTLLLEARNIEISYGVERVLDVESFSLYDGERVGLVGENGAGKSTLLKVLSGTLKPMQGQVRVLGDMAVISQLGDTDRADETMNAQLVSEFAAQDAREGLSGGERTRRRIAGALSTDAQILLADEPTVDLDEAGVKALEKHLCAFRGGIVLVSHDRALLDKVCTRICELRDGKITEYPGNYSDYRRERERRMQFARDEYSAYRAEEARLRKMIQHEVEHASQKQHLPSRMGNSEARLHKREVTNVQGKIHQVRHSFESRLSRLEEKERPREDAVIRITLGASDGITSRTALSINRLYLKGGEKILLKNAACTIPVGTRTALIGANGAGKTSLLRHIVSGGAGVRVSPGVRIGYFGQNHEEVLDMDRTVLENAMRLTSFPESDVRTVLARLNISAADIMKPARVLSGGERAKTALAQLIVSDANLLILDEPTNHLDIFSLEALENVLSLYSGTLLFVSHDRAFVSRVATRLMFLKNQALTAFEGTYEAYDEAEARRVQGQAALDRQMQITTLEMRLSNLAARLSAPQKGDRPEELNEAYFQLAAELKELKAEKGGK